MTAQDAIVSTRILVTVGEIANIAGVRSSAVSNWKRRHAGFPVEVEGNLYDRSEVVAWLEKAGKSVNLPDQDPVKSLLREATDAVRGVARVDEIPEVLLQLFSVRAAASGRFERLRPLAEAWERIERAAGNDPSSVYRSIVESLGDADPDLAKALRPSSVVDRFESSDWTRLVRVLSQRDPHSTNWAHASTGLVESFAERGSARGGHYSTGSSLVDVMTALLAPIEGTVYDPACGTAVFLASVWKDHSDTITQLYGQEISQQSWRLGFLHLLLQNAPFEFLTGDTMVDDRFWKLRADRVAVEPPFGLHLRSIEQMEGDPRWSLGLPPKSRADLAWVQHVAHHLSDSGVGVVVVPPGALLRVGRSEMTIRKGMVQADYVDAVLYLPPGMLAAISVPVAILVLQRNRKNRTGRVLFVDARQLGKPERGGVRRFEPAEVDRIGQALQRWRDGSLEPEARFTGVATTDQILTKDAVFIPNLYISYAETVTEIDGEPIPSRYERLVHTVDDRLAALPRAEAATRRQLSSINTIEDPGFAYRRLGELLDAEPMPGMRQRQDSEGDPTPYVTTGMVTQGRSVLSELPSEHTFGDVRDRIARKGDVLLLTRGIERYTSVPCASVAFDLPAAFSNSLIRLRVDQSRLDPDYLRLYLTSRRGRAALAGAATGSVISNLRRDALQGVEIHLPDLATQKAVVAGITAIETHMATVGDALKALVDLHDTVREGFMAGILGLGSHHAP